MRHRKLAVAAIVLILAGCGRGRGTPIPGGAPSSQGASNLPTAVPSLPSPAAGVPTPEKITTGQLNQRLNPFADPQCTLPCYNGLTPGQADFQAALKFYSRLGISPVDMVPGDYENTLDGTGHLGASLLRTTDIEQAVAAGFNPPRVDLALQGGVVGNVAVNWPGYPAYLTLPVIVQQLGQPGDLKIGLLFSKKPVNFLIQLVYTPRQTGFVFSGAAQGGGQELQVCLDEKSVTGSVLGVFATGQTPMAGAAFEKNLLPLESSTGVPYQQFVTAINSGACLSVPADKWAQWQALEK